MRILYATDGSEASIAAAAVLEKVARREPTSVAVLSVVRDVPLPRPEDAALLREYHALVLAPFLHRGVFDYGAWTPSAGIKRFMLRHPRMLALAPPPEALQLLRVMSGLKG